MNLDLQHFFAAPNSSFSPASKRARDTLLHSLAAQRTFDIELDEDTPKLWPIDKYFKSGEKYVEIHVGDMSYSWQLPEALLCDHSSYFKAAFRGHFSEARTKELDLTHIDPVGFEKFVEWIVTGHLTCKHTHSAKDEIEGDFDHCIAFCALFVLAEYLDMKSLQKETVRTVRNCMKLSKRFPSPQEVGYIFANMTDEPPSRQWFVESMVTSFFEESSFGVANWNGRWMEAIFASRQFCELVLDEIKEHAELEVCSLKDCTAHKKRNEARDRKLARSRPVRSGMGFKVTKRRTLAIPGRKGVRTSL